MELGVGRPFGKYGIEALVAETRMSRVWLARDTESNRRLALKTIRLFAGNEDLVEAARFGAVLQRLLCEQDPRVVRVYAHGESDGHFFIDMEFIEGRDVSQILSERGRIAPDLAVHVALAVAETLDNLHNFTATVEGRSVGPVVHGDLKPKNIRLAGDPTSEFAVKVLDFGTAKALSQSKPTGTRTPAWSPAYASPELLDRREMNPLSDRWALGVTLYEMVTGRVPFGAGKTVEEIEDHVRRRPMMPDLDVPDCPAALHTILFKLLNPDPDRRYQTARELCGDLKNYPELPKAAGYQGETVRSNSGPSASTATTRRSPSIPPAAPPPAPRKRPAPANPAATLRKLTFGLVLFGLFVWWLVREHSALSAANSLQADLAADRVTASDARSRWNNLKASWLVWFPTSNIEHLLTAGLITQGDEIVTRFRTTPLRAAEWQAARDYFEQARQTSRDDAVVGRVALCDAHLKRFEAHAEKRLDLITAAEQKFDAATHLLPRSPDPWLGLATVEAYNDKDPEKTEQSLDNARDRGFDFTTDGRWASMLAECYRLRAEALFWEAVRIERALPDQATERRRRAVSYDQKAIDWYSKIPLYGKSLQFIERCRDHMTRLQQRLSQPEPAAQLRQGQL
jgi:serine/threonine protein kinase